MTATVDAKVRNFDLVIAGGGMTGAMLAQVLLSQHPSLRLAIIEQSAEPGAEPSGKAPANSFDSRSIALSAGSVQLLQQFGIWERLAPFGCPIMDIAVSDRGHFGKTCGQVIERVAVATARFQQQHLRRGVL